VIVHHPASASTDGGDTTRAVEALAGAGATLVLFTGGDGTARDVADARPGETAVLGIPAGVKMYSACFALSPTVAGAVAVRWMDRGSLPTAEREVLDVDEDGVRDGRVDPVLHGTVTVPIDPGRTQARKTATAVSEQAAIRAAATGVVDRMEDGFTYFLGPGGTVGAVATLLGVPGTPLGVDVVRDGELVLADASERDLLDLIVPGTTKAVLTIIGGQGFLLGRGNQQISAAVLTLIGDDPVIVVATEKKLVGLGGRPLLVDTGDPDLDGRLAGHVEVVTGPRTASLYAVIAPESEGRV
jgi:predicted polyphosphate/ATP-dependent NAD kinase